MSNNHILEYRPTCNLILQLRDSAIHAQPPTHTLSIAKAFTKLARENSDCSSGPKAGGDLGFFNRRKMQQAFTEASFALGVGEMTTVSVDTASGLHIIWRAA